MNQIFRRDPIALWLFQVSRDLADCLPVSHAIQLRPYRPLAPLNLRVQGDGHCPMYSTGQDITVTWDQSSPRNRRVGCWVGAREALGVRVLQHRIRRARHRSPRSKIGGKPHALQTLRDLARFGQYPRLQSTHRRAIGSLPESHSSTPCPREYSNRPTPKFASAQPTTSFDHRGFRRLSDLENSAYFNEVCQDNFEVLAEESANRLATYQNGNPTTITGPPTSGTRVLNEFWRDALGGEWRCTETGSPGTWMQIRPAAVAVDPASGTIPVGYLIWNATDGAVKRHAGVYSWEITVGANASAKVGFHGAMPTTQRANVNQATALDLATVITLGNELRAALVEKGIIKGGAQISIPPADGEVPRQPPSVEVMVCGSRSTCCSEIKPENLRSQSANVI